MAGGLPQPGAGLPTRNAGARLPSCPRLRATAPRARLPRRVWGPPHAWPAVAVATHCRLYQCGLFPFPHLQAYCSWEVCFFFCVPVLIMRSRHAMRRLGVLSMLVAVSGAPAFSPPHVPAGPGARGRGRGVAPAGGPCGPCAPALRPAARRGARLPAGEGDEAAGGVSLRAKRKMVDRNDPEYKAVLARQRVVTGAMDILTTYDEAQADFTSQHADSNAPLGDWCGYHRRLTAAEREAMRDACKVLSSEASYVLIGLNAQSLADGRRAMDQWLAGLDLPAPDRVPYTDDTLREEYEDLAEMAPDLRSLFAGPVHMCYNSVAGADEETGDDTGFPPAAHIMPYPASDRGVVFTPILEGFFTQYGDVPLDLFDLEADARAPTAEEAAAEVAARTLAGDPDIATKQVRLRVCRCWCVRDVFADGVRCLRAWANAFCSGGCWRWQEAVRATGASAT